MRQFVGPMPVRISRLPRDKRGFPVPFFVKWIDNEPQFPVMDPDKFRTAVNHERCWICGERLGIFKAFCVGPMCCVNKVTSEPPSHLDCAKFAVLNCPFMANPRVGRQLGGDDVVMQGAKVAGIMIERNPGVSAIWVTKTFTLERHNGVLFRLGPPEKISFWASGRAATRAEVDESVRTGLPLLVDMAGHDGPAAVAALWRQVDTFTKLLNEAMQAEAA